MSPINIFIWLGIIVLSFYIIIIGKALLIPLVIAIVIWHLINALTKDYRRLTRYLTRGKWLLPYMLGLTTAILTFIGVIWFIINLTSSNIAEVAAVAPKYQANLEQLMAKILGLLGIEETPNLMHIIKDLDFNQIIVYFVDGLASIASSAGIILLYVVFLLIEQNTFRQKLSLVTGGGKREEAALGVVHRINADIQTYIWIKTLVSLLTAGISLLIMKVIGIDFAEFWAIIIFFANYIPNIGSILGTLFPSLIALVQFDTLFPFIMVAGSLGFVQFAIGNILEPKLMGRSLNLSTLVIFFSLVFWGTIWGILGMILCVPIMVIVVIILAHFPHSRPIAILLSQDGQLK
ncbi:AI-2E family transporter [Candidatus Parabeggiatoa sp. HSG14]|uniref:AI-2E family transporter n=1 Tax=Candidatus Parabeggiatoa sp. HSG14 TaxID=3055593 RepID=UPI0025A8DDBF|nr:AI-2E family transporter [Thiotrichales bacterium HSG14]